MNYATAADALMRRKILESLIGRMTPDERTLFVQMAMQNKSHTEIMSALQQQSAQIQDLSKRQQTFGKDVASNILGNAVWAGAEWVLTRLARLIR